jgi:hypothetical protein
MSASSAARRIIWSNRHSQVVSCEAGRGAALWRSPDPVATHSATVTTPTMHKATASSSPTTTNTEAATRGAGAGGHGAGGYGGAGMCVVNLCLAIAQSLLWATSLYAIRCGVTNNQSYHARRMPL